MGYDIETLKEVVKLQDDRVFLATIPKAFLGLSDNTIQTVSFVFWMCYMVETTMNDHLQEARAKTEDIIGREANSLEKAIMQKISGIDYDTLADLSYFGDKVRASESLMGKNDFVKMLWKIKNLRDDISHNRIDNLLYNGESLSQRGVKEKMLVDFIELSIKQSEEEPREFRELTEEEINELESIFNTQRDT